jgi:hypothetical protein
MSDKYIFSEKVSDNKKLEESCRKRINEWAKKIPNHSHKNLGDKIEVTDIWYKPSYPVRLRSQYEARHRDEKFTPFVGQSIPKRNVHDLNEVKSWDFELPEVDDFTNAQPEFTVEGSQHVEGCVNCHSQGWITCGKCHGFKVITCTSCEGSGKNYCSNCKATGKVTCYSCNGRGSHFTQVTKERVFYNSQTGQRRTEQYKVSENVTCSACHGNRNVQCSTCKGTGRITCKRCGGEGKETCPTCGGKGKNICPTCEGHKQLMYYFYVARSLNYIDQATCVIHTDVYEHFPEFLNTYPQYESYLLLSKRQEELKKGQLPNENHLNKFIDDYLDRSHNAVSSSHPMMFEQLDVACIDTWELYYKFNGKSYVMLFCGSNLDIIPGLSPIYEVALDYWKDGNLNARMYKYNTAYRLLKKAISINNYEITDDVTQMLNTVKNKIVSSYKLGISMAVWLCMFFGSFIVYAYFAKTNYVLDYASFIKNPHNFLFKYHAWAQAFTFMILCFTAERWSRRLSTRFIEWIPYAALRFTIGASIVMVCASVLFGILVLVNITGLTVISTFLFWLLIWILKIIAGLVIMIVKIFV